MTKNIILILVVVLVVGLGAYLYSGRSAAPVVVPQAVTEEKTVTFPINEQNASQESGQATLTESNGVLTVVLAMDGFVPDVSQPAHIHVGSCPDVGAVKYPLSNVVNGESITELDLTLEQLMGELPLAINVHKSAPEAAVYTACGDLTL